VRDGFLAVFYQPIAGKGVLVRISDDMVARSYFYWEFVVFFEKVFLIMLATLTK